VKQFHVSSVFNGPYRESALFLRKPWGPRFPTSPPPQALRALVMASPAEPFAALPEVAALHDWMRDHRRWFHARPELAFQEHLTAERVAQVLADIGLPADAIFTNVGITGEWVVGRGGGGATVRAIAAISLAVAQEWWV